MSDDFEFEANENENEEEEVTEASVEFGDAFEEDAPELEPSGEAVLPPPKVSFWDRLDAFMAPRANTDKLSRAIFILFVFFALLSDITWVFPLKVIGWVFLAYWFFRVLSTNKEKRQAETQAVDRFFYPLKLTLKDKYQTLRDKKYKYVHCPKCKKRVRVAKKTGAIDIQCPGCKHVYKVKS